MIYAVVGTDAAIREKAYETLRAAGVISVHVYSEQISVLEALIDSSSLFGDTIVVNLLQTMDSVASRDEVIRLLPSMKESVNIFIIDEPFADANRVTRLTKYAEKVFDAREEKKKEVDVFTLCNLFAKRDKKGVWVEWMNIRDKESPEAIHGALWWKFMTVWQDVHKGVPTKFSLQECEEIGKSLMLSSIEAHRGKKDLKMALEEIILGL